MPQPDLRTPRLLLTPLAPRHIELEVALDADAEVLRFLSGRAHTRDEVLAAHERRMAQARDGLGHWMAFGGETSPGTEAGADVVGLMMLPPVDLSDSAPDRPVARVAELGYRLHRRFWRQGLASEASRELLRYAFEDAGQQRVIAQTMAVNAPSRGVMAAVGMRHTRTFFPHFDDPLPGTDQGEVEYEITREDWLKERGRAE